MHISKREKYLNYEEKGSSTNFLLVLNKILNKMLTFLISFVKIKSSKWCAEFFFKIKVSKDFLSFGDFTVSKFALRNKISVMQSKTRQRGIM